MVARPTDGSPRKITGARPLASLGNRAFRFLWLSNLCFFGGVWTQTMILGWVVFEETGSELLLAVFTAVRLAPLVLGPFAGVLSDRYHRVRLLMIASGWASVSTIAVSTLATVGFLPYWVLLVCGLAIGLAHSPSQPARAALAADLSGRENISNANALNAVAVNMTQVFGPALGGLLLSTLGVPAALWISTSWYVVALGLLWRLRRVPQQPADRSEPALRMLVAGFHAVLVNRVAGGALAVTLTANILIWPIYQSFMPVFAADGLGLGAAGLGWLLTCSGVGGLTGAFVIAGLGDFAFKGRLFVFGTAAWGLLWAAFGLSDLVPLSFVLMFGIGLASAAFGVLQTTLLLMSTEPSMQGRVLGLQELAIGTMPVAALALGVIAQRIGAAPTATLCGALLAVVVLTVAVRIPELRRYSGR